MSEHLTDEEREWERQGDITYLHHDEAVERILILLDRLADARRERDEARRANKTLIRERNTWARQQADLRDEAANAVDAAEKRERSAADAETDLLVEVANAERRAEDAERERDDLRAAVAALADECGSSGCVHLNDLWGRLRALLADPAGVLAARDARVKAAAWNEGFVAARGHLSDYSPNPYSIEADAKGGE